MMHIILITLACVLGLFVVGIGLIIFVCYLVIGDEHLMLEHLERKHGLRDNE